MAARAFSFNIPKPVSASTPSTTAQKIYSDLAVKYATADTGEQVTDIVAYNYPSGITSAEIKFDRGFSREVEQRVLTANFGDGYQQRVRDGINTKMEKYSVTFTNRRWEEIALISSFFDVISPQNFDITLERETIKVICETFSVQIGHDDVQSISAEFRRVYEA